MPNKPNAKKALRQAKKRQGWNEEKKNTYKKAIKTTLKAKNQEEQLKLVKIAQKALDKAAKRGVIKKNAASRKLARLMKKINTPKKVEKTKK